MANRLPIDEWVHQLSSIPEREFTIPRVHEFVRGHAVRPETLAPYMVYSKGNYTRNLIYKCPLFELMAICWDVGQVSRIHNHAGQSCWMAVPIGRLAVQNYEVVRMDQAQGHCELKEASRVLMDPSHPTFVDREMPIHSVLNPAEYGQRATSLHVYSRPYDRCLVYDLEKRTYGQVPLFYDSEYGKRVAPPA